MVSDNFSLFAEYSFIGLQPYTIPPGALQPSSFSITKNAHMVNLGINYRPSGTGLPNKSSTITQDTDWTGIYAGVSGGYGFGTTYAGTTTTSTIPMDGGLLGAQLGVRGEIDGFVLGAESTISGTLINGSNACATAPFNCSGSYTAWATLEGTAGYSVDDLLVYVKGGAAYIWARADTAGPVSFPGYSASGWGYTVGAGIEYALNENWSGRLEYSYLDFAPVTAPAGTLGTGPITLDAAAHSMKAGLNYRF